MIEELEVIDRWWIAMDMYNLSMEKKWSFLDISGSEASDIFRLVLLYRLEGISNVKCKVVMCCQRGNELKYCKNQIWLILVLKGPRYALQGYQW